MTRLEALDNFISRCNPEEIMFNRQSLEIIHFDLFNRDKFLSSIPDLNKSYISYYRGVKLTVVQE